MKTITLWRPVGEKELQLIKETEWTAFPPRLSWQPIFYPVTNREYAQAIAEKWNTKDPASGYAGYVLEFEVDAEYLSQFDVHRVGGAMCDEYWIPAEELETFNHKIQGSIRIVDEYYGKVPSVSS